MVTITGASGYVGTALQEHLPSARCIDIESGTDILDTDYDDTVIHLAAVSGGEACEADPGEAARTNLLGTHHVATNAPRIVFASTVGATHPTNVYTETKRAAEAIVKDVSSDYLICRLSNLYGFVDGAEKDVVLNRFVRRAKAGKPLRIHEPGTQTRDFIHVEDVARHLADAAASTQTGQRVVGSGESFPVSYLAGWIGAYAGVDVECVPNPRPGSVRSIEGLDGVDTTHSVGSFVCSNL